MSKDRWSSRGEGEVLARRHLRRFEEMHMKLVNSVLVLAAITFVAADEPKKDRYSFSRELDSWLDQSGGQDAPAARPKA